MPGTRDGQELGHEAEQENNERLDEQEAEARKAEHPDQDDVREAQRYEPQPSSAQLSAAQPSSAQLSAALPSSAQISPAYLISQKTRKAQDCLGMLILLTKHLAGDHFFLLSAS